MAQELKYDVFISYSRKDAAIVNEVVAQLKTAGFSIWIDKDGIYSGDAFKEKIVNAIVNSSTVLFFSSESSNASQWVAKEIAVAVEIHKKVIPIRLDESNYCAEIMFDLVNLDFIDFTDNTAIKDCVERLIKTLGSKPIPPQKRIYPDPNPNPNKFKLLLSYKGCLISLTFVLVGVITLPFVFRFEDTKHKVVEAVGCPSRVHGDEAYSSNSDFTECQRDDVIFLHDVIFLQGNVAGKDADLKLRHVDSSSFEVELIIDGVSFFGTSYLNRRTLWVDLANDDGTFIGELDGLLSVDDSSLIRYKGTAESLGKTKLFKDGKFEFKGIASDTFVEWYQSQLKN